MVHYPKDYFFGEPSPGVERFLESKDSWSRKSLGVERVLKVEEA